MPDDAPTFTDMLWSEIVARANAAEGEPIQPKQPAYEFTRKTFYEPE